MKKGFGSLVAVWNLFTGLINTFGSNNIYGVFLCHLMYQFKCFCRYCSTAVYVKLELNSIPEHLKNTIPSDIKTYAVIWTTTPWTLPANKAVCYSTGHQWVETAPTFHKYICVNSYLRSCTCSYDLIYFCLWGATVYAQVSLWELSIKSNMIYDTD